MSIVITQHRRYNAHTSNKEEGLMANMYPGVYEVRDRQGNLVSNKWLLKITQTINGQVKRDTRTVEAKSKKRAFEMLVTIKNELREQYEKGCLTSKTFTFKELVENWKVNGTRDYSPTTLNEYYRIIDQHLLEYFGSIKINAISKGSLYSYIDDKHNNTSLTDKTIRNHLMVMSTLLTYAVDREFIGSNPCSKVKINDKRGTSKPMFFDEQQMVKIIELSNKLVEIKKDSFNTSIRYDRLDKKERNKVENIRLAEAMTKRLFVNLCLVCGGRRGEILGLRWTDINYDNVKIVFNGTAYNVDGNTRFKDTLKNNDDYREVYINKYIIQMFKELFEVQKKVIQDYNLEDTGYVFLVYRNGRTGALGQIARPNTYTHWFKSWLEANKEVLGLSDEEIKGLHVHSMRHTYVSYNLNKGVSVVATAELAGHNCKEVTMNIYGHGYDDAKVESARLFDNLYCNNAGTK